MRAIAQRQCRHEPWREPVYSASPRRSGNATAADADVLLMIGKLADLRSRIIPSEEEFSTKKTELLARL